MLVTEHLSIKKRVKELLGRARVGIECNVEVRCSQSLRAQWLGHVKR